MRGREAWQGPGRSRRTAALVIAAGTAVLSVLFVLGASSASAHAVLQSTTPEQGSEVDVPPTAVVLTFGESVMIDQNSLRVIDTAGQRADTGQVFHPGGRADTISVALRGGLPKGSYSAVWRVVSADSHPVSGTFSFGYGVPAGDTAVAAPHGSRLVGFLYGTARLIAYLGLVASLGAAVFAALVWPALWRRRATRALFGSGLGLIAAAAVGTLLLAGPYNVGTSIGHAFSADELGDTLGSRFGALLLLRLGLVALTVLTLFDSRLFGDAGRRRIRPELMVIGPVTVLTFSLSEHAGAGRQHVLATAIDALHLTAAAVWIGGLVVLLLVGLRRSVEAKEAVAEALPRWSRLAVGCVGVLIATGVYQGWREVGTWPAFAETVYGRLLLAKIGLLAVLLCLGAFGTWWVRSRGARSPQSFGALRRSVGTEVVLSVAALVVVAFLVNVQPGRDSYNPGVTKPTVAQGISPTDQRRAVVHVTSTRPGRTEISVEVTGLDGQPQEFAEISGLLTEEKKGLGPVRFTIPASATGRGDASSVVVPESGTWQLVLQIRTSGTASYAAATSYVVR